MKHSLLLLFLLCSFVSSQTTGTISGFIYDKSTGEALIGSNIFIKNTFTGATSNTMGFYSIPNIPVGEYTIVCQYMGYQTIERQVTVQVDSKVKENFNLEPTTIYAEEVTVTADSVRTSVELYRKPISQIDISPKEIERMPQVAEADLLRSLQLLPGISAVSDFSSELYVRGGTPDQNLYLIDGTDVYNPEHLFGLFSTFNTDAIKHVEISKGGFGAEYGGRLSSVLDVTNLDGNRREYAGKMSISLLSAKTTIQVPLGDIGAISGSIRRTYFDKTVAQLDAFKDRNIPNYYFYDGHLKAYFDLGQNDKLTLSTYRGFDDMEQVFDKDNPNSEQIFYNWGNTTASARWTHIFTSKLFSNFWITSSQFESNFDFGETFDEKNSISDQTVKGNLEYFWTQQLNLKAGFEYKILNGKYLADFPGGENDVRQKPKHFATYVQAEWRPSPLLQVQAGLRYNTSHNKVYRNDLDPRLSIKYRLTDTINLKAAAGRYHQYLFRVPRQFIADIWSSSDENYTVAQSDHFILGFQKEVARQYSLEIEGYYKNYDNIFVYDPFFWIDLQPNDYNEDGEPYYSDTKGLFDTGSAESYGLEILFRKNQGAATGWLAYTFGRVENTIPGVNHGKAFVPRHDRTHTFNAVANIDVKNSIRGLQGKHLHEDKSSWHIGTSFVYATGQPLTTTSSIYVSSQMPGQDYYSGYNLYPTARNNFRLPPYIRFDLSLTYKRQYKNFRIEPFLQVYNVTNRGNVWFITYEDELKDNTITQSVDTQSMLPILPSLGINIIF